MDKKTLITRRHGSIVASGSGAGSLILSLKTELTDMGLEAGNEVVISLVEDGKEKSIVIERLTIRG